MRKDRIRDLMRQRGHTSESLSEVAGIAQRTLWRVLQEGKGTTDETLVKLASALEVSADYLLGLTDDPKPSLKVDNLSADERDVLSAMRRGEKLEAIRIIASDH